jgi:hypothetical protein
MKKTMCNLLIMLVLVFVGVDANADLIGTTIAVSDGSTYGHAVGTGFQGSWATHVADAYAQDGTDGSRVLNHETWGGNPLKISAGDDGWVAFAFEAAAGEVIKGFELQMSTYIDNTNTDYGLDSGEYDIEAYYTTDAYAGTDPVFSAWTFIRDVTQLPNAVGTVTRGATVGSAAGMASLEASTVYVAYKMWRPSADNGSGALRITGDAYTFETGTPVPEPASLALLSIGGIALLRKKRN